MDPRQSLSALRGPVAGMTEKTRLPFQRFQLRNGGRAQGCVIIARDDEPKAAQ